MNHLYIIRHAKSSWAQAGQRDHARPLNPRGLRDAPRMGAWLQQQGGMPQLLISSTAMRTRQTVEQLLPNWEQEPEVQYTDDFYHAEASVYVEKLWEISADISQLVFVGHNFGVSDLVYKLTKQSVIMPTCAIAHIQFEIPWAEVQDGTGILADYWIPKEIK